MENLKGILSLCALMLIIMGVIGGIGYAIYGGSWPIAVGVVVLTILAWPGIKKVWKTFND